jgi:hypothetical protein
LEEHQGKGEFPLPVWIRLEKNHHDRLAQFSITELNRESGEYSPKEKMMDYPNVRKKFRNKIKFYFFRFLVVEFWSVSQRALSFPRITLKRTFVSTHWTNMKYNWDISSISMPHIGRKSRFT